jgi:hypothetical protein
MDSLRGTGALHYLWDGKGDRRPLNFTPFVPKHSCQKTYPRSLSKGIAYAANGMD